MTETSVVLSVVVPLFNEAPGLADFNRLMIEVLHQTVGVAYELIYCDDGSTDNTAELIRQWHRDNRRIKLIKLSRNFGKENALSAGIAQAQGQAILMLDGDGQHPPELIPDFVRAWQAGARIVVGIRSQGGGEDWFKRTSSRMFYRVFNRLTGARLLSGATDYRLIDRAAADAFLGLTESERITRGLIDWLGFSRQYIHFAARPRRHGSVGYNRRKLFALAANTFVSMSPAPLYLFGYLGIFITAGAFLLGVSVMIEQFALNDPWRWHFTGTAMLGILLLFLVGIVLMSQGILAMYISHIHSQVKRRPLYVIDIQASLGITPRA